MATPKSSNLFNFYLRENGSTVAYEYAVCAESDTFDSTQNVNERVTKCGTLKTPGVISATKSFQGVVDFAPSAGMLTYKKLLDWHLAGTVLDFVQGDASTGATLMDISGVGFISDFGFELNADEPVSFSMTFTVNGTPVNNL